ncbi:MAG: hypothetical protein DRR19_20430 [Candidatus Parabeggiatoa sp. nov. 1]|nr:MAG: hypothetical protein DRR19_20430 [Gammaproteobacteria bacterium]
MGIITLKVPQDIHLEYQIDSFKVMAQLLHWLKHLEQTKQQPVKHDRLLGLFADDADFSEQITEPAMQARENHHDQTPSQQDEAYAAAMQDYLSRPAKPLKKSQESYPPREALYDLGQFC